ncbi:MAG: polysaccharide biosynthesis tyrosine autokinase [Chthoniobacter sp.]|uniref:GumC family protein n=1 Tax=Chthoniobacter sp. TaxID=2510640 RepID=UPI0032A612FB
MNDSNEVKLHFLDYWRTIRLRMGLILLTFFLVMVTAGVTTYFLPKQYFSKVTMEVKSDFSAKVGTFGPGSLRGSYDPQFVATQFQILQKTEILYPVIERLDLIKEFSPPGVRLPLQQVYFRLKGAMKLQEVRNTGLIEIGAFDTDPQRAANIANAIAVVYQERRQNDLEKETTAGLDQLKDEVERKRKDVETTAATAMQIRARDGIVDPEPDKENSNVGYTTQNRLTVQTEKNSQELRVLELERQMDLINSLSPAQLQDALKTLGIDDPTVSRNLPLLQDAMAEKARLTNLGLGPNHPRVKAWDAQMETYAKILSDQLNTIKVTQGNRLRLEKDKLAALTTESKNSREVEAEEKAKMVEYIEAKNKAIQARKILDTLDLSYQQQKMIGVIQQPSAHIWEKAEKSEIPAKPNVPWYMFMAACVGLAIGVGLAFFIDYLDTSVKTLDDVERYLQIPVLAVIPNNVSILMKNAADSSDAEAYRILRAAVEFNKPYRDANTFTLISGGPGEGKSTTLNNLAFTCAKGGYNVLVVDADLRRASQHHYFDVENTFGLTDYLLGRAEIDEIIKTTKIDNLSFIPSGVLPPDAVGILNSQRMTDLIAKVKSQYDLVFFDSPPILGVSDGSVLASEVDITIMVVQHRRFPRVMLQRVKQAVLNVGGRLIGVVLNNVDAKHDDGYAYYYNYNEYYGPRRNAPKIEAPAPQLAARPRETQREEY